MPTPLAIALLALGCSQAEPQAQPDAPATVAEAPEAAAAASATAPAPTDAAQAGDRKLMFFLNPNGRPCQMQQAILDQLGDGLAVELQHVSVLDNGNRPTLYQYGVRSLPALILVDAAGQELHRFTPGIQSADTILAALD